MMARIYDLTQQTALTATDVVFVDKSGNAAGKYITVEDFLAGLPSLDFSDAIIDRLFTHIITAQDDVLVANGDIAWE